MCIGIPVQMVEEAIVTEHADEHDLESIVDVRNESEIVHAVGVVAGEGQNPGRDAQQEVELNGQQHLCRGKLEIKAEPK